MSSLIPRFPRRNFTYGPEKPLGAEVVRRTTAKHEKNVDMTAPTKNEKEVMKKKPPSRAQWLEKALSFATQKEYPIDTLFELIVNPKFSLINDDMEAHGCSMLAMIKESLSLFSKPQQKFLTSTEFALYKEYDENESKQRARCHSRSTDPRGTSVRKERGSPSGRRERSPSIRRPSVSSEERKPASPSRSRSARERKRNRSRKRRHRPRKEKKEKKRGRTSSRGSQPDAKKEKSRDVAKEAGRAKSGSPNSPSSHSPRRKSKKRSHSRSSAMRKSVSKRKSSSGSRKKQKTPSRRRSRKRSQRSSSSGHKRRSKKRSRSRRRSSRKRSRDRRR